MEAGNVLWVLGGYLAGTFPSAYLVSRLRNGGGVAEEADRRAGETDAHLVMARRLGGGWSALAAALDVLKGFVFLWITRSPGHVADAWLAAVGVAVVGGHSFPPFLRDMAGRGMAAMAGVYLFLLPVQMVAAGVTIVVGILVRATGLASTVAAAAVPVLAVVQGQPRAFVWMSLAILVLILARRLQGVGGVIRGGVPPSRAILYRALLDVTLPSPR